MPPSLSIQGYLFLASSLADLVVRNGFLSTAMKPLNRLTAQFLVFHTHATVHPLPPQIETASLQLLAHQSNHLGL
jgi:hypothetical protein